MNLILAIAYILPILIYVWTAYNIPILVVGVRRFLQSNQKSKKHKAVLSNNLPTMSIIVPLKNEEKVTERLLNALLQLDYPLGKKEIIIVEDGSSDRTPEICKDYVTHYPKVIKFFHREVSKGKPSALNFGFKQAKGEIVAVFDADNVPEPDTLLNATKYFSDPSIAAVQGTTCTINAKENMLTKIISYEEVVWLKTFLQGKDALNLFVSLAGSCQFIRRDVIEEIGLWNENCLAEDLEISLRITEKGYGIKFSPELVSWQEAPSQLSQLIKQRLRWYRGYMEVAVKYGRFLKMFKRRTFDAEVTLMGPYVLAFFFLSYLMSLYLFFYPFHDPILAIIAEGTLLFALATILTIGIALIYVTKPVKIKNVVWLPFIYAYWNLQSILTAIAFLQMILRQPRRWIKTEKTGRCTKSII